MLCVNDQFCIQCMENFSFNSGRIECVSDSEVIKPITCGENKTSANGQCVCDNASISLDGGVCFKCVPGSFKQG